MCPNVVVIIVLNTTTMKGVSVSKRIATHRVRTTALYYLLAFIDMYLSL